MSDELTPMTTEERIDMEIDCRIGATREELHTAIEIFFELEEPCIGCFRKHLTAVMRAAYAAGYNDATVEIDRGVPLLHEQFDFPRPTRTSAEKYG